MADFSRPVRFQSYQFDQMEGGDDPAVQLRLARDTAHALVDRARASADPDVVKRLVHYTDEHGLDAMAELWAHSRAHSLAGALWRIYLLRALIAQQAEPMSVLFRRGEELLDTIDPVVAGAVEPVGPEEVRELSDRILRGVFEGDFALALERAASFCRIVSAGATAYADVADGVDGHDQAVQLDRRALRLSTTAVELHECARLWRDGSLD